MKLENIIIKTKTNFTPIIVFLIGACFFGYFAYVVFSSNIIVAKETSEKDSLLIKWIVFGVFLCFSMISIFNVIRLKTFILTDKNLIVNQPFLLFKNIIPLTNINKIIEKNIQSSISRGYTDVMFFKGKESSIELANGKKVKFDSLTISNYSEFKKNISDSI